MTRDSGQVRHRLPMPAAMATRAFRLHAPVAPKRQRHADSPPPAGHNAAGSACVVVKSVRYVRWHTAVPPSRCQTKRLSAETDLR